MEAVLLSDDLSREIFSRLIVRDLVRLKCVCKHWKSIISDPSFSNIHQRRSRSVVGLYVQGKRCYPDFKPPYPVDEFSFYIQNCAGLHVCRRALSSYPDSIGIVLSSSNGLVCYRNKQIEEFLEISVHNPLTMESMILSPIRYDLHGCFFALAFFPFGDSSNMLPNFKVVGIHLGKCNPKAYYFLIYSSVTGKWKTSMEVCHCKEDIFDRKHIFVRGKFYWMTMGQHIISFEIEHEVSGVVELPGPVLKDGGQRMACLGQTDECLNYICGNMSKLWVWFLKDCRKSEWVLKHSLNLDQLHIENPTPETHQSLYIIYFKCARQKHLGDALRIFALHNDVVFFMAWGFYYQYDLRSARLGKINGWIPYLRSSKSDVLPTASLYSPRLAAVGCLSQIKNNLEVASYSARESEKEKEINGYCFLT